MAYTTNQSLLYAIKRGDGVSWQKFYETYRPLIVFCGSQKLNADEIDDLVQNVMIKVFNVQTSFVYSPERGLFRDYLGKIIHHEIVDIMRKRPREFCCEDIPDFSGESFEVLWLEQWEKHLWEIALIELKSRVSERTFQAFDLYVRQEMPPEKVAGFLDMKISLVYKAKTRCKDILQEIIGELRRHE